MGKTRQAILIFAGLLIALWFYQATGLSIPTQKFRFNSYMAYLETSARRYELPVCVSQEYGLGMDTRNSKIAYLNNNASTYQHLLKAMEGAGSSIYLEIFTFRDDKIGQQFKDLLASKARQGIEVCVLYDAWGSLTTSPSFFREMEKSGVKVAAYNPLLKGFFQGRIDNRLHRKIIVIDSQMAFIGGGNIGDEYLGQDARVGPWKDTGIMIAGQAANSLQQIFLYDWSQSAPALHEHYSIPSLPPSGPRVFLAIGGPDSIHSDINKSYCSLIGRAKNRINITTPYFLPDDSILAAMESARGRGVEINLLVSRRSDNRLAQLASGYYLKQAADMGVNVHYYEAGFIHSKLMITDRRTVLVGTANLDYLSSKKSYEANAIVFDQDLADRLEVDYSRDLAQSGSLAAGDSGRNMFQAFLQRLIIGLIHLI